MNELDLFQLALGLSDPWYVERVEFDKAAKRLDLYIDFRSGGTFACPGCGGAGCKAHDTTEKVWRHLNFFQYEAYLHVRTPRVGCSACGVKLAPVPWARHGSGFTLLFEAYVLSLCKEMPVLAVARLVGEHDTRIWRVVHHYIDRARERADHSQVAQVGVDETASKRGQNYITLFADLARPARVLFATEGRSAEVFSAFASDLEAHGGDAAAVRELSMDLSAAFQKGAADHFPQAEITFDKFHVLKLMGEAVDEVRRAEQKQVPALKGTRWMWLKNERNLTARQRRRLEDLTPSLDHLKTGRAYQLRLALQEAYRAPAEHAEAALKKWCAWAQRSRLDPVVRVGQTIRRHWAGVMRYFTSRLTNAAMEGINSLVQAARARARGYRSTRDLTTMVYLLAGRLDLGLSPI
jgi:transposase